VDVEDPARPGHDLDGLDAVLELLEQPRRQTGGVREGPSGDAVLDPDAVPVRHERILSERFLLGAKRSERPLLWPLP
jgi:hypothetical protein